MRNVCFFITAIFMVSCTKEAANPTGDDLDGTWKFAVLIDEHGTANLIAGKYKLNKEFKDAPDAAYYLEQVTPAMRFAQDARLTFEKDTMAYDGRNEKQRKTHFLLIQKNGKTCIKADRMTEDEAAAIFIKDDSLHMVDDRRKQEYILIKEK